MWMGTVLLKPQSISLFFELYTGSGRFRTLYFLCIFVQKNAQLLTEISPIFCVEKNDSFFNQFFFSNPCQGHQEKQSNSKKTQPKRIPDLYYVDDSEQCCPAEVWNSVKYWFFFIWWKLVKCAHVKIIFPDLE